VFLFYDYDYFSLILLQILVIFSGPGIVKVNVIRNIAGQIVNRDTLTGLILIVQNQITSQALKAINLLNFKVEIFQVCFSLSLTTLLNCEINCYYFACSVS
jgi:hypothetical protein